MRFLKAQEQAIGALVTKAVREAVTSDYVRAAETRLRENGLGEDQRDDYRFAIEKQLKLPEDTRLIDGTRSIPLGQLIARFRRNFGSNGLAIEIAEKMTRRYGKPVSKRHVKTCRTKAQRWLSERGFQSKMRWYINGVSLC
ncbi:MULTISPECIES: hypothetical protein [Ensifer]|uniref:hypothetical protein n=1 Tax=Ensifer TaxID=106591 RepID=UPI00132EB3E5|nr:MULTISPECIES: hypothetical protein [Ensifer]MBD9538761.1 hypothetical protein [Ensifer sp. ENS04]QHG71367.1 hypothetical protein DQW09_16600 [Ensifer adhaerens]